MAEMTIQLRVDPVTGKKDIVIALRSDEDLLPHEHEQQHQALVEKLIGSGLVQAEELGQVIVERLADEGLPAAEAASSPASAQQEQRRAEGQGA